MKILSVVGARPNFMKVAPIIAAIEKHNGKGSSLHGEGTIQHLLVHTGQHYGDLMSDSFFADLGLPKPDVHMGVGSGTHAVQSAEIMKRFEEILLSEKPDVVIVVGDVNSTLACAVVTAKISFDTNGTRPLIAHVEAGLRSFDRAMPEEINRVVTDHVADLLFVTEESGVRNLKNEGISPDKIHFVGNTMIDSLLRFRTKADSSKKLEELGLRQRSADNGHASTTPYALLTMHRPANVDDPVAFREILSGLEELAADFPIVFPVHPRTRKRMEEFDVKLKVNPASGKAGHGLVLTEPVGYIDFLCLMKNAKIVVTDSGGIQEETTCLGVPCVTVRDNTERPVTVDKGTNVIAGTASSGIRSAIRRQLIGSDSASVPELWDGHAAERIVEVLNRVRQPNLVRA
ncbi:MAG TPA: UDP-N-acetylglucosamine 2-epimerase (non-hydrolyzing) [Dongiaceae bacterium]|nr:UDP-N-acetylglucosamine 2-epimerase (non-hydrolyzing) [Dongiaceae bacterium]